VYYRLVEATDKLIGDVLDALERSPYKDNTVIVYTSDHGEMLGSHRMISKEKLYEESATVPLIIAAPGQVGSVDKTHNVIGLDLMPTFLDYAGVAAPASLRGKSLRPIVEGKPFADREYVAAESFDPEARMIRTARYKYMRYALGERREQLFDLENDPHESKNLIAEASLAKEVERHRGFLAEWMKRTDDLEEGKGTALLAKIKAREGDTDGK
jgi:choline-sulfatase